MPGPYPQTGSHYAGFTSGQHSFAQIPQANIQRSSFDRSCGLRTAFHHGILTPIFVDEALPGDTFDLEMRIFGRFGTMLKPVMENIHLDFFFFAVPCRLVWDNWNKFMGEQTNPGDSTDFEVPQMNSGAGYNNETLHDYLGIPTQVSNLSHSSLWHRAYNLIFNEWFRDENLVDSVVVDKDDGPDSPSDYVLLRRGKRHDYFTSCLPFPQKGPTVELPLGSTAPVVAAVPQADIQMNFIGGTQGTMTLRATPGNTNPFFSPTPAGVAGDVTWVQSGLMTDLAAATAATINQIREAFQIQKMFERDARGGTRYTEILRSHFGVVSPDARLQRPEFLGGGSTRININPVANTNFTTTQDFAFLAGYGTTAAQGIGFRRSFTEHCLILGLVAARADLTYQQGLERMFSRLTRFDYYWPSFAHLGEQSVLNKEIFAIGVNSPFTDDGVFGYQERYAEYRYKPSRVTGKMRSNDAQSLDTFHLSQEFAGLPVLDPTFIVENPPIDRILAVSDVTEPAYLMDAYFAFRCARPMPVFSVPGLIDHF